MEQTFKSITQHTNAEISTVHHALRAPRRRLVILILANQTTSEITSNTNVLRPCQVTVSARQIAKRIVAVENDVPLSHATGDEYHNVYTALCQVHFNTLDTVNAIKYNADRKMVSPDTNLFALATVVAYTTPITKIMFDRPVDGLYSRSK